MRRRTALASLIALTLTLPAFTARTATVTYRLDSAASTVAFETDFGPDHIAGTMPVVSADVALDFDALARCSVDVVLAADKAIASFPFATQALRGPKVLDTANHPTIHFTSTRIRAEGDGARVEGAVTIRGVTRPTVLHARFHRSDNTAPGTRDALAVRLTGEVHRAEFGATGWLDMVGDVVRLDIVAEIRKAP